MNKGASVYDVLICNDEQSGTFLDYGKDVFLSMLS